jgi:Na+/melibiose symporter-like transporter
LSAVRFVLYFVERVSNDAPSNASRPVGPNPSAGGPSGMTLGKRLAFLAGQLGVMLLARFFFTWILKFADQTRGLVPHLDGVSRWLGESARTSSTSGGSSAGEVLFVASAVGGLFLAARVVDGLIDPLVGGWSDGWVARGRERRSLLLYTFFLAPIGLGLAFSPAFDQSSALRWTLLVGGFVVFFVGYTAYAIPLWSLVDDYGGDDARERSILSNLLGGGILLSVALVSVAVPIVLGKLGYARSAIAVGAIGAVLMVLAYFSRPRRMPAAAQAAHAHEGLSLRAMLETLRDRRYLAVVVMFSGSQMALTVVSVAAPFVCERLLGGTDADVAKLMGPFLGSAIPCFAFVPAFSRRFGWERAMLYASLALSLVYVGVAFLGRGIVGTPMTTAMILFFLGGPAVAVLLGLESEAIANSARASGSGRVSLYFGMFNLCVKALNGVATFLTSLLVSFAHDRPELAATSVRAMGVMAAALLFSGVGLYFVIRPKQNGGAPAKEPAS